MTVQMLAAASVFTMLSIGIAQAACTALEEAATATNAADEQGAMAIFLALQPGACTADETALLGRFVALATFNRIVAEVGHGAPLADYEAELLALPQDAGAPWQVFDALGDINRERKDYQAAARYYQLALEDAANETLTPDWMAPDATYITRLDRMATEMRLAAPLPVTLSLRGACKVNFRGVALKKKATPVRYVYNTAQFTPEGLISAGDVSNCLKSVKPATITLTGHTDPVGTAEFNRGLSLRRAQALADYLVAEGYAGTLRVVGKGEDEPFQPDDASAYDEETRHRMDRRVDVDVGN